MACALPLSGALLTESVPCAGGRQQRARERIRLPYAQPSRDRFGVASTGGQTVSRGEAGGNTEPTL